MKLEGLVGTEQRLHVVLLPQRVAAQWSAAAFDDATAALGEQERDDGVVAFAGMSVLVADILAGVCGVFREGSSALTLVGLFPKVDTRRSLKDGFDREGALGPSSGAMKIDELIIEDGDIVVMNANPTSAKGNDAVSLWLEPGRYDVWGESYELKGAWGSTEVRVRLVPQGQGILVGAPLGR